MAGLCANCVGFKHCKEHGRLCLTNTHCQKAQRGASSSKKKTRTGELEPPTFQQQADRLGTPPLEQEEEEEGLQPRECSLTSGHAATENGDGIRSYHAGSPHPVQDAAPRLAGFKAHPLCDTLCSCSDISRTGERKTNCSVAFCSCHHL